MILMDILVAILFLFAFLFAGVSLYLFGLTLASVAASFRKGKRGGGRTRFAVVIPAHDEALNIENVVKGVQGVDYPADLFDVVVVADNCSDDTARRALDAGADVVEREDSERRGKGYALDYAFKRLLEQEPRYDAFVVLDADSLVSDNFLREMDAAMEKGAQAVQAHYDVLNPEENWRTALMYTALCAVHLVRPLARSHFGLSVGLKGNGMCFSREVVDRFGWNAFSVVEDMEYGFNLCLEGIAVDFAPRAKVRAQMAAGEKESTTQRIRWEGGRQAMVREWFSLLLWQGIKRRSIRCLDLAVDLLIPPLTKMVAATVVLGLAALSLFLNDLAGWPLPALCGISLGMQGFYVLVGLVLNRSPIRIYLALLHAPFFIVWKMSVYRLMKRDKGVDQWVRTGRTKIGS